MKRHIEITKENGSSVYGDSYEVDVDSPQMERFSTATVQDFEEVRKAMIKYDFTTKDIKSWEIIAI